MDILHEIVKNLSQLSTADLYVIGGVAVSGAIWALNNVKELKTYHNVILSFLLPGLLATLSWALSSGNILHQGTDLYVASQGVYWVVKGIVAKATSTSTLGSF